MVGILTLCLTASYALEAYRLLQDALYLELKACQDSTVLQN